MNLFAFLLTIIAGLSTLIGTIFIFFKSTDNLIKKALAKLGTLDKLNIAILGLTFKPGTDDLREAPSIEIVQSLLEYGSNITVYDPIGEENFKKYYPTEVKYALTPEEALKNADLCFILTEWDQIKEIKPETFKNQMKTPLVYDGRNIFDLKVMEDNGIEYYSIGRSLKK